MTLSARPACLPSVEVEVDDEMTLLGYGKRDNPFFLSDAEELSKVVYNAKDKYQPFTEQ